MTKLTLTIVLVSLLVVAVTSLLANFFIGNKFKSYIQNRLENTAQDIVATITRQYDKSSGRWDAAAVHSIGMSLLYDGFIIRVSDAGGNVVWDAETCDMSLCTAVLDDISHRMTGRSHNDGALTTKVFDAMDGSEKIGTVNVKYPGPYFFSEGDFNFLDALNRILILTAIFTLFVSLLAGFYIARRLSRPILTTAETARKISEGDYDVRIGEETNTIELDRLIGAINQLGESLKNQEDLRKQLTADVAHELRTPITTAQTHLEAMIEGCWEPTKERLQSCYDEMTRISRLVRDLESLAKVESGNSKLDRSMISLKELSNNAVLNFEAELKNKELRMSVEGSDSRIFADKYRIDQVLMNLMSNAIKYTPEGGNIDIRISETEDSVILEFEDNGIGIPEEELPLIFERFYRADKSRNRMTGGSGIGLAIVRSIIAAHGGTVEVRSSLNSGTCFTLTFPKTSI